MRNRATQVSLINAPHLQQRLAVPILYCGSSVFLSPAPRTNRIIRDVIRKSQFPRPPNDPPNRVVFEIFPDPASELDVPFGQVSAQQLIIFQSRSQSDAVPGGLLPTVRAKSTHRLRNIGEATLFEQMK